MTKRCRKMTFLKWELQLFFCNGWIIYSSDCRLELQVKVKHCQSIGNVGFVESLTPLCNGTLNICSYRKSHFNKKICCCHFDKLEAMDLLNWNITEWQTICLSVMVVKAFILAETVAQLGNSCTGQSCLERFQSNLRCCKSCWAMKSGCPLW